MNKLQTSGLALFVLSMALVVWFVGRDVVVYGPKTREAQPTVEHEFSRPRPLPDSSELRVQRVTKHDSILVTQYFRTSNIYDDVKRHYLQELLGGGWVFVREETLRDWGRDLGGRSLVFCKPNGYRASVHYAGQQAQYGWDFAVSVGWKPSACE